jgi:hypothetical protein
LEANKEGYPCLLSGGAPDSPGHHRTTTIHVRCAISFLFWRRQTLQIRGSWHTGHCPVHTGQSGAPCRPLARATRRPWIARSTVALTAVGSLDSPVNYSRTPPNSPQSGLFTGVQPGAPDTVRCARLIRDLAAPSQVFWFFSFLCF